MLGKLNCNRALPIKGIEVAGSSPAPGRIVYNALTTHVYISIVNNRSIAVDAGVEK